MSLSLNQIILVMIVGSIFVLICGAVLALYVKHIKTPRWLLFASIVFGVGFLLSVISPVCLTMFGPAKVIPVIRAECHEIKDVAVALRLGLLTEVKGTAKFEAGILRHFDKYYLDHNMPLLSTYDDQLDTIIWCQGFVPKSISIAGSYAALSGTKTNENMFCFACFPRQALKSVNKLTYDYTNPLE